MAQEEVREGVNPECIGFPFFPFFFLFISSATPPWREDRAKTKPSVLGF